jgi:transcriptional regulator with XRE-family HTH domain
MQRTAFGAYLRTKRIKAGLSLREVARELNVSHVYLGEVERGVRGPLKRERWEDVIRLIPGTSLEDLEHHARTDRPIQLDLRDVPPEYQDLGLALARRIQEQDLSVQDLRCLTRILRGEHNE